MQLNHKSISSWQALIIKKTELTFKGTGFLSKGLHVGQFDLPWQEALPHSKFALVDIDSKTRVYAVF